MRGASVRPDGAPPPVTVRDATPADRPLVVGFMAALQDFERLSEPNRLPGAECADRHLAHLEEWAAEGGGSLVAEIEGRAVGWLIYGVEEEEGEYVLPGNRRVGSLSDLWVEPGHRGRGIAAALVAEAEQRLRAAGIARVEVSALPSNHTALAVYRRLGYADCLVTLARAI